MLFFSLFDRKAGTYGEPFMRRHTADAVRSIQASVEDPKSVLSRHAADFDLYLLSQFNPLTGLFDNLSEGGFIANLATFKALNQEAPNG